MTALTEFLPYVQPKALGASRPVALFQIREACEKFCRETHIVQQRVELQRILTGDTVVGDFDTDYYTGITVNSALRYPVARVGSAQYVAAAPTGMRPHDVQKMWYRAASSTREDEGQPIHPITPDAIDTVPNYLKKENVPQYYIRYPDEIIDVVPAPSDIATNPLQELEARISFIPLPDATEVDDSLFRNGRQYIAAHALWQLYDHPDQPYSDPKKSKEQRIEYRNGVHKARYQVNTGRTRASIMPRPQPWA